MSDDEMASAISENYPQFAGDPAPSSKPAAAPAPAPKSSTVPNPVAPDQPAAASSGGLLDAVGGWYNSAKKAILDVPVLAPGQEPGQPAPGTDLMANAKGGPDLSDLPVTPEYLRAMQAQWNAATPAQRRQLAARKDHMGVVAQRMNEARPQLAAEEAPDTLGILGNKGVQLDTTSTLDQLDPTAEARTRRLIRGGVRGDLAGAEAHVAAARDIPTGAEASLRSSASTSDFDFETFRKFNEDPFWKNPVVRGAVKGYEGYKQGILGMNQAIGEAVGADVSGQAGLARRSRGFTEAMGESPDYLQRNFEGTISSIAQQLPALIGGAASGSEGLVLGSMFAQSFGQEYSDSRAKGQQQGAALTRAGLFGAFEVVGEKLGLGERLQILRNSAKGVETNVLAKWMANTLKEELPGEMLTTTGQFLTDKLPGIGMAQNAGLADYLQQMGDTVTQTIMQGGLMSAGTGGVNHARGYLNGAFDRGAEHDANAAQRDALNAWNTNGLSPSSRAPGNGRREPTWAEVTGAAPSTRVEPSIGDIAGASSVDEAIAAAAAVAAAPIRTPASTSPFPTAAEIDALEAQAGINGAPHAPLQPAVSADVLPGLGSVDGAAAPLPTGLIAAADPARPAGDTRGHDAAAGGPVASSATGVPGANGSADASQALTDDAGDWHPFPPESQTLGIPRAQMPQIRAEHRGAMVNFLNARGISHEQVEVDANELKPTQQEFSISKVQKAIEHQGGNRSILISSDNYVLDGHHQWLAAAEKGEAISAIRLNAPIRQLVNAVHEFPSSTVDTSSAPAAPARPGQLGDANAAESVQKRKTAGQRARNRVTRENPFLAFLANHGVQIDERSDTGGQKGRAGGVMVPGYGPLYRKGGKRLDELAQLAHEAGFLSQQDIDDPTDTGGTRKLADMIQRAAHSKEVIHQPSLIESAMPTVDDRMFAEAESLGIDTTGKSVDQVYDEIQSRHKANETQREVTGAASVDEQALIEDYADQFTPAETQLAADLLRDADIPLEGGTPSNHLTDEEVDAIFGIQPGRARAAGQEAEEGAPSTPGQSTEGAGQPGEGQDLLTSYTAGDVLEREDAAAARAKAVQAERDKLEARRKAEQDAKEARARADASVDDFQLGQDAHAQLSGQRGMFDEPAPAPAAPAEPKSRYDNFENIRVEQGHLFAHIQVGQLENGKWVSGTSYRAQNEGASVGPFHGREFESRNVAVQHELDTIKDRIPAKLYRELEAKAHGIGRDGLRDSDRAAKDLDSAVDEFTIQTKEELASDEPITAAEARAGALAWAEDANLNPGEFLRTLYRKWTRNANNVELQELAEGLLHEGEPAQAPEPSALQKEVTRAKKGGKHDNATAPEHLAGVDDRELGEIVTEFKEAQAEMMQDGHAITNVFTPPKKKEVVRLKQKALATGVLWDEKESTPYLKDVEELAKLEKKGEPVPAGMRERIAEFEVDYLPHAAKLKKAADIEVGKWIAHAQAQGVNPQQRNANSKKVVLSFFDLSGEWSRPWEEAGYEVHRFDIQADPEMGDVNNFSAEFFGDWFGDFDGKEVYAILAACPCTDFASSGSRHFAAKDADGRTVASVKLVHQTLRAIEYFKPSIWALENPVGRIEKLGGLPPWRLSFDPNHLGDTYTKKTMIWGRFNADLPVAPVEPVEGSKMWKLYGGKSMATKNARSETPPGFSYGFFMANNAVDHLAMAIHGKYDRLDRSLIEKAIAAGVTEEEIDSAVGDPYYMELDDDAANDAIRELIAEARDVTDSATPTTPAPTRARAAADDAQIPLDFYKSVNVDYLAVAGIEPTQLAADEALANTREDIDQLEAMLKCMGG